MLAVPKKAGIREVAEAAGVAISTVSKVFNPNSRATGRISPSTRQAVMQAAAALNYKANYGAQLLRGSGSRTIGFAIALPGEHFASYLSDYAIRLLNGLGRAAATNGYQLLLINNADYEYYMDINRIDGLVIIAYSLLHNPQAAQTAALYERFNQRHYPYVVINHTVRGTDAAIPFINTDNEEGMRLVLNHILAQGYESVGFLGELTPNPQFHHHERLQCLRRLLRQAGLPGDERAFLNGSGPGQPDLPRVEGYSHQDGYEGTRFLHENGVLPRCLVCGNDTIVLGALKYAAAHGIRVPEELALIGFDDLPNAAYFSPALTTVRQPLEHYGHLALEYLIRKIADPTIFESHLIKPEFIVRKSG